MSDIYPKEKRSWVMSRIHGKNTSPECCIRSMLHRMGYRFRLHRKDLPGKPDIVLPRYRSAIFVNGCFWHRHENCKLANLPKSNVDFWKNKFNATLKRDQKNKILLEQLGWRVLVIWECEIPRTDELIAKVRSFLS